MNDTTATDSTGPLLLTQDELGVMTVKNVWDHCLESGTFHTLLTATIRQLAASHGVVWIDYAQVENILVGGEDQLFLDVLERAVTSMRTELVLPADKIAGYNDARVDAKDKSRLCHAPATAMNFTRNGSVLTCCHTRNEPLGHYPKQSIREIWFGPKRLGLRDAIQGGSLPLACSKCFEQIKAGNYTGALARGFDRFAPSPSENRIAKVKAVVGLGPRQTYPKVLEFELSNKCNLECKMCVGFFSSSIRANRENLPPLAQVYDSAFVSQLKEFIPHATEAVFVGGEPFLIDLYYEIWELFIQFNPSCIIRITTNGTVLTDRVKRVIEKLNCHITVSVDSVDKETYELVRKNAKLESTLANIEKFKAINVRNGRRMLINTCALASNWHTIPGVVEWANANGLQLSFPTVFFPKTESLRFLPASDLLHIADFFRRAIRTPANDIEARNFRKLEHLANQVDDWRLGGEATEPGDILHTIQTAQHPPIVTPLLTPAAS